MVISQMTEAECLEALAGGRVARLACARDNQPYVVPIYYASDRAPNGIVYLYGFTTVGQKVEWMRANPQVCVEWDEINRYDQWASVVAFGRYEELPPPPRAIGGGVPGRTADQPYRTEEEREWLRATDLLRRHATWWQPGGAAFAARKHREQAEPFQALYYRIRVERLTGHRATPDKPTFTTPGGPLAGRFRRTVDWLAEVFSRREGPSA
jgi:nitroimidazol reductase NimA-like FMN-containing flavoprotein (pyridoxamine 5'-phosphate oxidase superfamily)